MKRLVIPAAIAAFCATALFGQAVPFLGMGDSLGEGVQSANASTVSQPDSYLAVAAGQMGGPFALPLIQSNALGFVDVISGRTRISPTVFPANLAVSGANTQDVLTSVASSTPAHEIDLVLPPYIGLSQLQIAEQTKPGMIFCWIGSNDVLGAILAWNHLNGTPVTPLPAFTSEYQELVTRLKATGSKVVLANIPNVTDIAFLFNNADLLKFTGVDYGLPSGYYTTLPTMVLLKLGVFNASILQNPSYVLDPAEVASLQSQLTAFNQVISQTAASAGFPVVDANGILNSFITHPITINGDTLTTRFNGGAFSLDGVHPSNFGHALFAEAFIAAANVGYGLGIPAITNNQFYNIFLNDPFQDKNGNGVVTGRPFTGLIETLAPFLGLSGDKNDAVPAPSAVPAKADVKEFMRLYRTAKGLDARTPFTSADVEQAVAEAFVSRF